MYTDEKQRRLHELFSELRRIKQEDLLIAEYTPDSIERARRRHIAMMRIIGIEREIDRVMREG